MASHDPKNAEPKKDIPSENALDGIDDSELDSLSGGSFTEEGEGENM